MSPGEVIAAGAKFTCSRQARSLVRTRSAHPSGRAVWGEVYRAKDSRLERVSGVTEVPVLHPDS